MQHSSLPSPDMQSETSEDGMSFLDVLVLLLTHWKLLIFGALLIGALAVGITFLIRPIFTATTILLPPQQQQSAAAAALSSLGSLANIAGASAVKSPSEQYVSLLLSTTVSDRIIERFKLRELYRQDLMVETRRRLARSVRVSVGKRDNLISIEVDDVDPRRAADMANAYVEELRRLTTTLAVTEAQQRRMFFERQLQDTKTKLTQAQTALQASGFNQGALQAEPKAAAEGYAKLKAEAVAAEVRLRTLQGYLSENAAEYQLAQSILNALRVQLQRAEQPLFAANGPDYVSKYREFKYQETLFELLARQYELARVDESREGAIIQVVDSATPPERKSRPARGTTGIVATVAAGFALILFVLLRESWRAAKRDQQSAAKWSRLGEAFSKGS